jgi:hypothetical protein
MDLRCDANVIQTMQCQREIPALFGREDGPTEPQGCIVGCFIQKTVLMRDSATMEIIHRWPDKVGEPLNNGPQ